MLRHIIIFEARYQMRSYLFVVSALIFFVLAFTAIAVDGVQIGARGNANLNAPYSIMQTLSIMSVMTIFIVTAFIANVIIRDDDTGFAPILRSTRISKFDYLVGRFAGASIAALGVLSMVPLALLAATFMPWVDPAKLGPTVLWHYLYALLMFGLPTLLTLGALFFALATLTRSMMWSYIGAVATLVLFGVSRAMLGDPAMDTFSAMADPFGIGALSWVTRYWTTLERNTLLPELNGLLLYNRLLWLALGAALFALTYVLFRFERRDGAKALPARDHGSPDQVPVPKPLAMPTLGARTAWRQFLVLARFDMTFVFKSPAFCVLLLIGVVNSLAQMSIFTSGRGSVSLPVTRAMVEALTASFSIIPLIIAVYYAGELVWRDRDRRMHELVDASAAPSWTFMLPKVLAITGVLLTCYLVAMVTGMLFQLAHGYTDLAPLSYLLWFVLPGLIWSLLMAVLGVFLQALVPHKFLGWGAMLLYIVLDLMLGGIGFTHNLYRYAGTAGVPLSDMNGMGHFWIARAWQQAYWLAFAAMLLVLAHLLWPRGTDTRLGPHLARLRHRLVGLPGLLLGGASCIWIALGGFVFYNTNVLNAYQSEADAAQLQADYEKTLMPFAALPQPTIKKVTLKVALYPRELRADIEGSYLLENRSGIALDRVDVQWNPGLEMRAMTLSGATPSLQYQRLAHRVYTLAVPMQPGEERTLQFHTRLEQRGFVNDDAQTRIVENGTFVDNLMVAPFLGVPTGLLMQGRVKRRKYGLPSEMHMAKLEDDGANAFSRLRHDSDFVDAEITLSTDADQTPVAPGYTVSESTHAGRRTLVTRTETPIVNFFSMQSARYEKNNSEWTGPDGKQVALQVVYHPAHASNVARMQAAMKVSLDVFSSAFSAYQFRQLRIAEFPAYEKFAQSFAGTVPFSEALGFIQNYHDANSDNELDNVTGLTAHEVAHQWFGYQLVGADKEGSTLLSETLAQYAALLVAERINGKEQIRKFLKNQLDAYLSSRSNEVGEERPLARVENQGYIHYNKGAVSMYWLKEVVGEEVLNRAIRKLIAEFAFKGAPYADTRDFLRLLRAEAGPRHEQLIVDLFEKITLYDLSATDAQATRRADGRFDVSFTLDAAKIYADGSGHETQAVLDEEFDIGAFTAEPGKKGFTRAAVLMMERRRLNSGKQQITLVLEQAPSFVGVDPYNMRIDRNSNDNLCAVTLN